MAMGDQQAKRLKALRKIDDMFEALGGVHGLMELTGSRQTAVTNWRTVYRRCPAKTYLLLQDELKRRGYIADPQLFGMLMRR
jgi:hypothetical protein